MSQIILAIETSCDETAVSILKDGKELIVNSVDTQIEKHKQFGGVYPELACRLHLENISKVLSYSLSSSSLSLNDITHIAVTCGPGLPGALQIGIMAAKTISSYLNVPLIPVHHLAGHIYANEFVKDFSYPLLALIASGGNSDIVYLDRELHFEVLGETLDDAIGESFDKVARLLSLPYPGGVMIDKLTKGRDDIELIDLPKVSVEGYNLSFSGLKSHISRMIEKDKEEKKLDEKRILSYAKSVEINFVDQLLDKLYSAYLNYHPKMIVVGGGVSANSYLRKKIKELFDCENVEVIVPPLWCTTDNAAMIAKVASRMIDKNMSFNRDFSSKPSFPLSGLNED